MIPTSAACAWPGEGFPLSPPTSSQKSPSLKPYTRPIAPSFLNTHLLHDQKTKLLYLAGPPPSDEEIGPTGPHQIFLESLPTHSGGSPLDNKAHLPPRRAPQFQHGLPGLCNWSQPAQFPRASSDKVLLFAPDPAHALGQRKVTPPPWLSAF